MKINLVNPWIISVISFYKKDFKKQKESINNYLITKFSKNKSEKVNIENIDINNVFKLRVFIKDENETANIEIYLTSNKDDYKIDNQSLLDIYNDLDIQFKNIIWAEYLFNNKKYIITNNFIDFDFPDKLFYDIYYKKYKSIRYIYSDKKDNEFIIIFLKHIIKFDTYYSKILKFYRDFSIRFPEIQKSNVELIEEYSLMLEWNKEDINKNKLNNLNKRIYKIQSRNFWLLYDIESLESNLDNLKSRLRSIWGEDLRYFQNHIEKANFIIWTYKRVLKKNNLVKENILDNYIQISKNTIEENKLEQESKKINHIKNIKEVLWWLAFIEIFINWLSQSAKIFEFSGTINKILENTDFMRMSLVIVFLILYFLYYFIKKYTKI